MFRLAFRAAVKVFRIQERAWRVAQAGQAVVVPVGKYKCCVTGSSVLKAIRASHIKPWRDASNEERLDPYNGLPLIATLDVLFDAGLISFNEDGKLIISRKINSNERKLLGLKDYFLIKKPDSKTAKYLSYHREYIFINS